MKSVPTIADAEEASITDQILLPVFPPRAGAKYLRDYCVSSSFYHPETSTRGASGSFLDKCGSGAVVLRAIDTKPAGFFHKAVRNLFLFPINWSFFCDRPKDPWSDEELARVLRACSGVVNLVLFAESSSPVTLPMAAAVLAEMRPQRITLIAGTTLDLTHPVFNNTVLLLGEGFTREAAELHDQRLVVHENQQDFFEGGEDIWARVDEFMARRQRAEIPDSCFHLLTAPEL
ncbi:hypothetical protein GGX14DRAFT_405327 [Mycena pura]|uniref:Uncharacterized protein n=1 Tax=Mycena pura TaxID=153505 RepID=A0AAD6Y4B0_9AGAR|nr:hypothetical protein GGX14DRAFT_405327 [Mycena pura]